MITKGESQRFALNVGDVPAFVTVGEASAEGQGVPWNVDLGDALLDYRTVRDLDSLRLNLLGLGITLILTNLNCTQKAMLHCFNCLLTYCPPERVYSAHVPDTQQRGVWSRFRKWLKCSVSGRGGNMIDNREKGGRTHRPTCVSPRWGCGIFRAASRRLQRCYRLSEVTRSQTIAGR